MTKNQLAKEVAVSEKLHLSTSIQAVDGVIRVIKEQLAKNEPVIIRGLGTFQPVIVPKRQGHNPQTGAVVTIPEHRTVKFRISRELVAKLNEVRGDAL
jgi:DNA-binding protein HU-beta